MSAEDRGDFTPQQYLEAESIAHRKVDARAKQSLDTLAHSLQSPFRYAKKHADCDDSRSEVVKCYRDAEKSGGGEVHNCRAKIMEYGKCVRSLQQRHLELVDAFKTKREALREAEGQT